MRSVMIVLLACLLLSCGGRHNASAPPASRAVAGRAPLRRRRALRRSGVVPWQYPVHGIDVSKYQGDIDWSTVRRAGIDFAFIKATEGGDHTDDRFRRQLGGARAAGMPRGAYHYYYFCRPALEQAAWFINHVPQGRDRPAPGPRPRVDPQVEDLHLPARRRPRSVAEARIFLAALTAYYGRRPVIYTTVDFYRDNELWRLDDYPFWLRSVAGHPLGRLSRPALALLAVHRHRRSSRASTARPTSTSSPAPAPSGRPSASAR